VSVEGIAGRLLFRCDWCLDEFDSGRPVEDWGAGLRAMRAAGWLRVATTAGVKHLCEECAEMRQRWGERSGGDDREGT
jgi:hypothetical protein